MYKFSFYCVIVICLFLTIGFSKNELFAQSVRVPSGYVELKEPVYAVVVGIKDCQMEIVNSKAQDKSKMYYFDLLRVKTMQSQMLTLLVPSDLNLNKNQEYKFETIYRKDQFQGFSTIEVARFISGYKAKKEIPFRADFVVISVNDNSVLSKEN